MTPDLQQLTDAYAAFNIITTVLETPHVVVGAAIAFKLGNPLLAIPLAFGSHFLLDKIPHWNPHLNREKKSFGKPTKKTTVIVVLDVAVALAIGGFVSYHALPDIAHASTILLACFASVLPDVIEGPFFFLNHRNKLIEKWITFQKSIQVDASFIPGMLTQIITVTAALWWIFG